MHFGGCFSTWVPLGTVKEVCCSSCKIFSVLEQLQKKNYGEELDLKHGTVGYEGLEMLESKSWAGEGMVFPGVGFLVGRAGKLLIQNRPKSPFIS